ncbi:MAG: TetR/AcrR family transcriptional regulator [Oleibacter sp.]|nr:TetR/AcrR family transcriptional regulator [Thalassolituus sp.]
MIKYKENTDHRSRLLAGLATVLESKTLAELYADDIVRAAGVSKRTFYQHFKNKQECFLALYEENSAYIVETLLEATSADESFNIIEQIERGAEAYLGAMQAQAPLMKRLYIDILALGSEGLAARRRVIGMFAKIITDMYGKEQQRQPALPDIPEVMLTGIIAGLNELILYRIEDGKADDLIELASTTREIMMGSIQLLLSQGKQR